MALPHARTKVVIRPLTEADLAEADRIVRLAFGTFIGLADPSRFMGDTDYVRTRWKLDPSSVVAAEHDGKLVGTNFATNWGSFGFFGPLTVDPAYWDHGIAQQLLGPTMEIFRRWGNGHLGLFTFSQSPKHMSLYQKFGFWPRDLVAIMAKILASLPYQYSEGPSHQPESFSKAPTELQSDLVLACRDVTNAIFEGLDVEREIRAVAAQKLGDTLLVWSGSELAAFAVCHTGPRTEAGTGVCYVKFAAVRPSARAGVNFARLLDLAEEYGRSVGAQKLVAGVNLARRSAFTEMYRRGFRTDTQGVAMETGDASSGYNRDSVHILDDWR